MRTIDSEEIQTKVLDSLSLDGGVETFLSFVSSNSTLLPNWWSEQREMYLRKASIENDMISSVMQTVVMKLFTLPISVVPVNPQVQSTQRLAEMYTSIVQESWNAQIELFLNDMLVHDKGAFLLVNGNPNVSEPIQEGQMATGFKHIPSQQILLRDDKEFPYQWQPYKSMPTTNRYLIHHSRIIRLTQMPTSVGQDSYAGLSFVSRAFNVANLMTSSIQYGLEGLGKLDSDQIVWATSLTSKAIHQAFKEAQIDSQNSGLQTNGRRVYLGIRDPAGKIGVQDLKRLPANFNYETFLRTTIKLLAIACGIDEDDIAATSSAGTTKTAVLVSDLKSRFKLVAWFTNKIIREFEQKFLPKSLRIQIGETKNEINESEAKTRINIARTDDLLVKQGTISLREARKNAVRHGFITHDQFEELELQDGRLPNGLPVHTLFLSENEMIKNMLNIGVTDACQVDELIKPLAVQLAHNKLCDAERIASNTTSHNIFKSAQQAIYALLWFVQTYDETLQPEQEPTEPNTEPIEQEPTDESDEENSEIKVKTHHNKKPKKPRTVNGRKRQKKVRQQLRNIWSTKSDNKTISPEDIITSVDTELAKELNDKIDELEQIISFTYQNTQENNGKLADIYATLDDKIQWDLQV